MQSTVNVVVFFRFLPVNMMSETSVKVKIQHDQIIHPGHCPQAECSKEVSLLHLILDNT